MQSNLFLLFLLLLLVLFVLLGLFVKLGGVDECDAEHGQPLSLLLQVYHAIRTLYLFVFHMQ